MRTSGKVRAHKGDRLVGLRQRFSGHAARWIGAISRGVVRADRVGIGGRGRQSYIAVGR